jgi:protein-S-isoprenylcysteine O-methyltransferase Ste14
MTSSQAQAITAVGAAACWSALVLAWVAGAAYNAFRGPKERTRRQSGSRGFIGAVLLSALAALAIPRAVSGSSWEALTTDVPWVRLLGLIVLIGSTALALWARFALGTMWSLAPLVKDGHQLRTDGPYGITRHPIYTGLLGMLLGTVVVVGLGRSVVILPVFVVVLELKLRTEERLMLATFPDEYPRYRRRVPQLVPGLRLLHRVDLSDV